MEKTSFMHIDLSQSTSSIIWKKNNVHAYWFTTVSSVHYYLLNNMEEKHSVLNYFKNLNHKRTMNTKHLKKDLVDTLNNWAPKKSKIFRGNQKPHINKALINAKMKRSKLKSKANKIPIQFLIPVNHRLSWFIWMAFRITGSNLWHCW